MYEIALQYMLYTIYYLQYIICCLFVNYISQLIQSVLCITYEIVDTSYSILWCTYYIYTHILYVSYLISCLYSLLYRLHITHSIVYVFVYCYYYYHRYASWLLLFRNPLLLRLLSVTLFRLLLSVLSIILCIVTVINSVTFFAMFSHSKP